MTILIKGYHGRSIEGIYTYRINATNKDDLYLLIDEAKKMGYKFWETPNIENVFKTWSVLLKLYIPNELGYPTESS